MPTNGRRIVRALEVIEVGAGITNGGVGGVEQGRPDGAARRGELAQLLLRGADVALLGVLHGRELR